MQRAFVHWHMKESLEGPAGMVRSSCVVAAGGFQADDDLVMTWYGLKPMKSFCFGDEHKKMNKF